MIRPGCYNRPALGKPLVVQDGYREYVERGHPVKIPVYVEIPYVMTIECQWSKTNRDRSCRGCSRRASTKVVSTDDGHRATVGRANQVSKS